MKIWDAVVVGGGPAGASAAYDLARQGKQVVILEKKTFPRVKPCAGGLTIKALARLRFPVNQLLQGQSHELRVGYKNTTRSLVAANSFCAFTVREQFDDYCLRQA
ncbi:MAG: FAD-dependent oxidoreductase, partial [Ketobacteraceae bacterium]|nr:FAD-dependent oxidoreductase [Ketobacteraceae bacterium]